MARLTHTLAAAALGAVAVAASPIATAQNTVWKCTDADGRPHYTNVKEEAKAPSCKVVAESKVSTVPATAFPGAAAPAARPNAAATPTPANFPRVDANTQKARDDSRRKILEEELAAEQRSLQDARAKLAGQADAAQRSPLQDTVERHERNIAALQREIGNLR